MRLVQRMGHDVQQRQREQRQPALQHHETHLRHSGPRERGFDRRLRQHHHTAKNRRKPAQHDQHRQHAGGRQHHISKPDHQEPSRIDDARMQQGRYRRRRFHHLGQPAVGRELRRFQHGGQCDQPRRPDSSGRGNTRPRRIKDCRNIAAAKAAPQHQCGHDDHQIGQA